MGVDRAHHVAATVQVEQEAIVRRAGGDNPLGGHPTGIHRRTFDIVGSRRRHFFHYGTHAFHVRGLRDFFSRRLERLNRHLKLWASHTYPPFPIFVGSTHLQPRSGLVNQKARAFPAGLPPWSVALTRRRTSIFSANFSPNHRARSVWSPTSSPVSGWTRISNPSRWTMSQGTSP